MENPHARICRNRSLFGEPNAKIDPIYRRMLAGRNSECVTHEPNKSKTNSFKILYFDNRFTVDSTTGKTRLVNDYIAVSTISFLFFFFLLSRHVHVQHSDT